MRWPHTMAEGFNLYNDHNNLMFIFDPLRYLPDQTISYVLKVLCWAVSLSWFNSICYHISGTVWVDLLGLWSPYPVTRRLISVPPLPSASSDEFEGPTEDEIRRIQTKYLSERPDAVVLKDGLFTVKNNSVWILESAESLQLRICVTAHTSSAGHRGISATKSAIQKEF